MNEIIFQEFPKMARYSRECIITEKIDGTNAQVIITDDGRIAAASRTRLITPTDDNYGFARWVEDNKAELLKLGPGRHFGEWWGSKIQRTYGRTDKVFSLFNVSRWIPNWASPNPPQDGIVAANGTGEPINCCRVVPILARGAFDTYLVNSAINFLAATGSAAQPGFMSPEGIVIWHCAANIGFKKTILNDESPKSSIKNETNNA